MTQRKTTARPARKAAKQTTANKTAAAAKKTAAKKAAARPRAIAVRARKAPARSSSGTGRGSASERITARIRELGDWRGEKLALVRKLIHEADPAIVEEWKWLGTPVWSHDGIVCTGESYQRVVKLTFAKGASLADPRHLFNTGFAGNTRRAIDIRSDDEVDGPAFRALIREAVAYNQGHPPRRARS